MKAEPMSFFDLLRRHAAEQPEAIASRSSRRSVTYRRFWSRIERATARLIGEWQVQAGDTLVYWGCAHQDALMFYIAAARCGARLLPLEHSFLRQDASAFLTAHPPKLILHDDDLPIAPPLSAAAISDLSSLVATRCHHAPHVVEDEAALTLVTFARMADGSLRCGELSLASLRVMNVVPPSSFQIDGALFDTTVLGGHVLPVLAAGGTIVFR